MVNNDLESVITPELKERWKKSLRSTIKDALNFFAPPPKLSISQWADRYRILATGESPLSGKWNTDTTPYLRKIMDCMTDTTTEIVAFLKSSQVGATEVGINICGYTIEYDPARLLYVMPDDELAKDFSRDRATKALKNTPSIARKLDNSERSKTSVIRFPGGFIRFVGSQSPAKLASWAIPRVIMDEVDKYPRWAGREASPIKLVEERTKNWAWRKILIMSTPTLENGNIYQAYINSEVRYKYYVPCPHCGEWQVLTFGNLKFPTKDGLAAARKNAYYQCESCGKKIKDEHKHEMLAKGKWIGDTQVEQPRKVGFSINALYSPFVSFGEVAEEFLSSKDDPALLMNFTNSWLGECWKDKASTPEIESIYNQRTDTPAGFVPKWAKILTAGVDCQQGYFYWVVRAWGVDMRSQKIANGMATTFADLQNVMDYYWKIEGSQSKTMQILLYCVDSGYNTEAVYDYCYANQNIAYPVKGSSKPIVGKRYTISSLTAKNNWNVANPMNLYIVDTDQYKNYIFGHLVEKDKYGAWMVDADTDEDYAKQLCSEHKVIKEDGRFTIETWEKITHHTPNHYLDCEVYAAVAADIANVRYLQEEETAEEEENSKGGFSFNKGFNPFGSR